MTIETCREIAARIWCDFAYQHIVMDVVVAEKISRELFKVANEVEYVEDEQ